MVEEKQALDNLPSATYRLQLNSGFTFLRARAIVPYLSRLGISHIYSSPCLLARPGSLHGYDIVDHSSINPEIGSREEFDGLVEELRAHGMGLILDIVPNHMGVGYANPWWVDILENGQASVFDGYLDIDWNPLKGELKGKVLVPVLGGIYGEILKNGEIKLVFNPETGEFHISYYEHRFPIDPKTYPMILSYDMNNLESSLGKEDPGLLRFASLLTAFKNLPDRHAADSQEVRNERRRDKELHKLTLASICGQRPEIKYHIERSVDFFNDARVSQPADSQLHNLLERQAYRLAHWRVASDEVNYRRFFEINELIGVRTQQPKVADAIHKLVDELLAEGKIDGLRIDHLDGMNDPAKYLARFRPMDEGKPQAAAQEQVFKKPLVYLEKILAPHEKLSGSWPAHGTTGYDFTGQVNGIFVQPASEKKLTNIYERFIGRKLGLDELEYQCKRLIIKTSLSSELSSLAKELDDISESSLYWRDFTLNAIRDALREVVASFPVYRTYVDENGPSDEDRKHIKWAIGRAKKRSQAAEVTIFDFIRDVLLMENIQDLPERSREAMIRFVKQFQQYTPPVMAKGVEDTAFYIYTRLISLNEVGSGPSRFGTFVSEFHRANAERRNNWPLAMLSTSTHDTKRSEDTRARINVISEIPAVWGKKINRWSRINRPGKRMVDGALAPDRNDEYLFYQTLAGVFPAGELNSSNLAGIKERVLNYMLKAVREAKVHTSWINANQGYEEAVSGFIERALSPKSGSSFLAEFAAFHKEVALAGAVNSLSQLTLKLTSPGVPDIYQGCELMDFSLVDPDNRRPVDFELRNRLLMEMERTFDGLESARQCEAAKSLWMEPEQPKLKLYITWRILSHRKNARDLYIRGTYQPLETGGPMADRLIAFAREQEGRSLLVIVPRWNARITGDENSSIDEDPWKNTWVKAAGGALELGNLFTGAKVPAVINGDSTLIYASDIFADFPVAVLTGSTGGGEAFAINRAAPDGTKQG